MFAHTVLLFHFLFVVSTDAMVHSCYLISLPIGKSSMLLYLILPVTHTVITLKDTGRVILCLYCGEPKM